MLTISIRAGKEKQLLRRHPWVLPGAIASVSGSPSKDDPDVARVVDSRGAFIAYGWYHEGAHTPVRLLCWDEHAVPDDRWLATRIDASIARRDAIGTPGTARRLVFGEADGIPGLAVDQYGDYVVAQLSAAPAVARANEIASILQRSLSPAAVRVRTDESQRSLDSLPMVDAWIGGDPPAGPVEIKENGTRFVVDLVGGQKTGFYLDQRDNRVELARFAAGRRVLDAFSYSGGFACSFPSAREIVCVDSSGAAGSLLRENARLNRMETVTFVQADVFSWLRDQRPVPDDADRFGLIVLDPPKMARGERDRTRAMRGYKDLVLHALPLVAEGGLIAVFSCSAAIGTGDLLTAAAWAALDAGSEVRAVRFFGQATDHPVLASFPESRYLSGVLLQCSTASRRAESTAPERCSPPPP